jgi:cobalamin biosynthesis protein CobT
VSNISSLDELAAALNEHQVTDEEGQLEEETSTETTATQEENTVDESETAEKSAEALEEDTQSSEEESESEESQHAEDETGKRYVPEDRFKKVYAQLKEAERKLQTSKPKTQSVDTESIGNQQPVGYQPSKADLLELKMELPQFDPKFDEDGTPTNPDYSPELDRLGAHILKANPGMTPLQAGREAVKMAKEIAGKQAKVKIDAQTEKSIRSDTGITSRVQSKGSIESDAEKVLESNDDQAMEAYLKKIGQW